MRASTLHEIPKSRIRAGCPDERQRQRARTARHTATDSGAFIQRDTTMPFRVFTLQCNEDGVFDDAELHTFSQEHQVLISYTKYAIFRAKAS
jgi:hypothetical protein